jgi:hypothetical protein
MGLLRLLLSQSGWNLLIESVSLAYVREITVSDKIKSATALHPSNIGSSSTRQIKIDKHYSFSIS